MKIFAIRDEYDNEKKDLAYLLYYEKGKQFYIELPDDVDEWEAPLLFASFVNKGERTINSYWSKEWVRQRITPSDRQNISDILRDNKLKEYDEFDLLMLAKGRCAQDDYYLTELEEKELPKDVTKRFRMRIEDVVPLQGNNLLVFFSDGTIKKCSLTDYFKQNQRFSILLSRPELFFAIKTQIGGYGVMWDYSLMISHKTLYKIGKTIPLTVDDFKLFVTERIVNTSEAAEILGCSRQYVNELVKKQLLHPVKTFEKNTLFLKSEVLQRNRL